MFTFDFGKGTISNTFIYLQVAGLPQDNSEEHVALCCMLTQQPI